jgi:hypothetical protein
MMCSIPKVLLAIVGLTAPVLAIGGVVGRHTEVYVASPLILVVASPLASMVASRLNPAASAAQLAQAVALSCLLLLPVMAVSDHYAAPQDFWVLLTGLALSMLVLAPLASLAAWVPARSRTGRTSAR